MVALSLGLLTIATNSSAQMMPGGMGGGPPGGMGGMGGMGGGPGGRGGPPGGMPKCPDMDSPHMAQPINLVQYAVRDRLNALPKELKLDDAGLALYATYRKRVEQLLDDELRKVNSAKLPPSGAMRLLAFQMDQQRNRLTAWEDVADATQALYDHLSVEQRRVADERLVVSLEPREWAAILTPAMRPL
jgi:hypothetical protein